MQMDGVDGLNTVGMWVTEAAACGPGDSCRINCVVIAPEVFRQVVRQGVEFELWDGGFFATGAVLERIEAGWPTGT